MTATEAATLPRPKILLVDDHEIFRAQLRKAVASLGLDSKLEVIEAEDGVSGSEVFQKNPSIEFMVVDVFMPRMTGPAMLAELHSRFPERIAATKIFMMTTEGNRALQKRCREYGVDAWFMKPINTRRFFNYLDAKYLR